MNSYRERIEDIIGLAEFVFEEYQEEGRLDPERLLMQKNVRVCFDDYARVWRARLGNRGLAG